MGYLGCAYPGCGRGKVVGKLFCPSHLKTPFTTKKEVNAYHRGVREGIRQTLLGKKVEVYKINTKGMGSAQLSCLVALVNHKGWERNCGWLWDTPSGTEAYMQSFVKRGLATVSKRRTWNGGETDHYTPTEGAKKFITMKLQEDKNYSYDG